MPRVEEADMKSSRKVLFNKDDDPSPRSHTTYEPDPNGQEPTTPPPQRPLFSIGSGSSNRKYLDANRTWSAQDNAPPADDVALDIGDGEEEEEEEESDNDATPRPSTEQDRHDMEAPTQENDDNRADGVEPESTQERPSEEKQQHYILYNSKNKRGYLPVNVVLYQAALKGDWKTAKSIFDIDPLAITKEITDAKDTALHIAAAAKRISFVEKLVQLYKPSDLEAKNENGNTVLAFAAASGVVRIAEVMVEKNPNLPNLHDANKPTPVLMAVAYKRKDMASFLFSKTNFEALLPYEQIELLIATISSDYYDIALEILIKKPELAKERMAENTDSALHVLAKKSSAIGSSNELGFWKRHINNRFKGFYNKALMQTLAHQVVERIWNYLVKELSKPELSVFIKTPSRLLHDAARVGNAELLIILIRSYPDLLWKVDKDDKSIFHVAVENRQESVFSLIYEIGGLRDFLANYHDRKKNSNMLHLAGMLAAPYHLSRVSGAALQMQRELLWFKEVEKIVVSSHLQMKSPSPEDPQVEIIKDPIVSLTPRELFTKAYKQLLKDGDEWMKCDPGAKIVVSSHLQMRRDPIPELSTMEIIRHPVESLTPRELFTKEHKQLLKDGEEWMKNTANSCMLVATLIATVVFAAAFTVPGGNGNQGTPTFRENQAFTVFVISDVVALVLSSTSILTFLSILTSRYAEEDFLMSLPIKLLFGLVTLFLSISCMLVAFSATFFIAYDKTRVKIPLAIAVVSIIPAGCFCIFHSKLVVDIFRSAYWSQFSLRKHKKRLF
ncbi:unnamed protein product [Citrullus colocynthis]|uniref:PGG domain-containing protein n=1 Tax=Citrullus colocynthis TaxID=252529 RepID=A0ABP0Z9K2_9ROSI